MSFELPELPYALTALEPYLSKQTLEYHYGKHHKAYVDNLNSLIAGTPFEAMDLEEIIVQAPGGEIFNNAAQVWNHTFYWACLSPVAAVVEPDGLIREAIDVNFGSVQGFKERYTEAADSLFGSGWTWLVRRADGSLAIEATRNADNPIKHGQLPLLACDVWEHAYYIDYRNARPRYLEAFWELVNWRFMAQTFTRAE
ncbi:MAG: superoxide dismutase [Gammaproteobacteria bacterium]